MGILDFLTGGGDQQAQDISQQMVNDAKSMPLPVLKEYYPELYKQVVELNPELDTAINLGPSKMEGISTDPALKQAQMSALNKLIETGNLGGRDAQFIADQNRIQNDVNTNLQGQTGAIQQNMATRGMSGGMSEMVAKQLAAQGGANRQAQMEMDSNAQAQSRALNALIQSGQLGGQMQSQDFNQKAQQASAQDQINRFNAQNQQNVQSSNVAAKNAAQQYNATGAQNVANQNTQGSNAAKQYNLNLSQQQYDNEMKKRGLVTGAQTNLANNYQQESAGNRQVIGGLLGAGAQAFGSKG